MKKITIHNYIDPGHSWYKVPYSLLLTLEINKNISSFSYERRGKKSNYFVYLEEDCDFTKLVNEIGIDNIKIIRHYTNRSSKIRNYDSYCDNF